MTDGKSNEIPDYSLGEGPDFPDIPTRKIPQVDKEKLLQLEWERTQLLAKKVTQEYAGIISSEVKPDAEGITGLKPSTPYRMWDIDIEKQNINGDDVEVGIDLSVQDLRSHKLATVRNLKADFDLEDLIETCQLDFNNNTRYRDNKDSQQYEPSQIRIISEVAGKDLPEEMVQDFGNLLSFPGVIIHRTTRVFLFHKNNPEKLETYRPMMNSNTLELLSKDKGLERQRQEFVKKYFIQTFDSDVPLTLTDIESIGGNLQMLDYGFQKWQETHPIASQE